MKQLAAVAVVAVGEILVDAVAAEAAVATSLVYVFVVSVDAAVVVGRACFHPLAVSMLAHNLHLLNAFVQYCHWIDAFLPARLVATKERPNNPDPPAT